MNGQLALLKRSILTDSRSVGNYLSALAGGIVFFILFLIIGESRNFTGLSYLKTISLTNLFIITITGVVGFSSAITEEKEDDTLGLLLMSGISPTTLIFSKAISRTIRGLYLTLTTSLCDSCYCTWRYSHKSGDSSLCLFCQLHSLSGIFLCIFFRPLQHDYSGGFSFKFYTNPHINLNSEC